MHKTKQLSMQADKANMLEEKIRFLENANL